MNSQRANRQPGPSAVSSQDPLASQKQTLKGEQARPSVARGSELQLTRGEVLSRALAGSSEPSYLLYLPSREGSRDRPLVLVHGQSRGADDLVEVFRPFAEHYGAMLIAPVFDRERSAGYQRLGLSSRSEARSRPDVRLRRVLEDVRELTGRSTERFHLFGHSGGAQFAHRFVMAHPESVERYAISAAGWYTSPDPSVAFPHGMKAVPKVPNLAANINKFLGVPACVLVGAEDTLRNASLNTSARVDRTQGRTRVERASNWVTAMATAARQRGLEPAVRLQVLPEVGHRFGDLASHGRLGQIVSQYLFDEADSE